EIRDTVVNKYESVKESVSETLDWREQYRKRPIAWSVGAGAVGLLVGYSIASAFKGDGEDYSDVWNEDYAPVQKAYAGQAITGGSYGSSALAASPARTAQSVVLPLIFKKIKNYFGLDLSSKSQRSVQPTGGAQQAANAPQSGTSQEGQGQSSTAYGKSPNAPYGAQSP